MSTCTRLINVNDDCACVCMYICVCAYVCDALGKRNDEGSGVSDLYVPTINRGLVTNLLLCLAYIKG